MIIKEYVMGKVIMRDYLGWCVSLLEGVQFSNKWVITSLCRSIDRYVWPFQSNGSWWQKHSHLRTLTHQADGRLSASVGPSVRVCGPSLCGMSHTIGASRLKSTSSLMSVWCVSGFRTWNSQKDPSWESKTVKWLICDHNFCYVAWGQSKTCFKSEQ